MKGDAELQLRQLCYRLRRQGMLELDAWLEPLVKTLEIEGDPATMAAAEQLLAEEPPALMAMMHGERNIPESLLPWLGLGRG